MARVANDVQYGGTHYKGQNPEVWDIIRMYGLNYFTGNALKYLLRTKDDRVQDLRKAMHYIEKELEDLTSGRTQSEISTPAAEVEMELDFAHAEPTWIFRTQDLDRDLTAGTYPHRYSDRELEGPDS